MKLNFEKELTPELFSLLEKTANMSVKSFGSTSGVITLDGIVYSIVEHYLTESNSVDDPDLQRTLLDLPNTARIRKTLYSRAEKSVIPGPVGHMSTQVGSVLFGKQLTEVFERLSVRFAFIKTGKKIGTSDLFEFIYSSCDCSSMDLLKNYGLYLESKDSFGPGPIPGIKTLGDILPGFDKDDSDEDTGEDLEDLFNDNTSSEGSENTKKGDNNKHKPNDDLEDALSSGVRVKRVGSSTQESKTPMLDQFSIDMTKDAGAGKYDPVLGRDLEVSQIIEILCCRKKNNAVILGDPGCGKTAIIEHLSTLISAGEVPKYLQGKRICSLDLNGLVAGTKYRGEFEERLQGIIKEVIECPELIVYIDEFHNLVGSGNISGSGDASNILKPYLARGEFQCIGSTTLEEYRKIIEKDGALKRRFQNVTIEEPSVPQTKEILTKLAIKYSEYHGVSYDQSVIDSCVEWSDRYITDRFFPDKAIDVLDQVGSLAKLSRAGESEVVSPEEDKIKELNVKLKEAIEKMIECSSDINRLEEASDWRDTRDRIKSEIDDLEKKKGDVKIDPSNWVPATTDHVAKVVSKISRVPLDKIHSSDFDKIRKMKSNLEASVIGQEGAINDVTLGIHRGLLGLRDTSKPLSYLFVGPTGVGKTLICKEIASQFFGDSKALIRYDMSEYSDRHTITRLTGAPPSYVGYDDTPGFEQVRKSPYSVILFDEIEKAHPNIFNIFLQILDEGVVTMSNGTKVDFRHSIVIFTGNVGTKELQLVGAGIGYSKPEGEDLRERDKSIVMKAVGKEFKPEFINRLSGITVFNSLKKDDMLKIINIELTQLQDRIKESGKTFEVSDEVKELIVSGVDLKYGARDLKRGISKNIEDEICNYMISPDYKGQSHFKITVIDDKISIHAEENIETA